MLKHKICNINYNISESHSNTTVHQFEAMNSFSQYCNIGKYHGMVFTNTTHPYYSLTAELEETNKIGGAVQVKYCSWYLSTVLLG